MRTRSNRRRVAALTVGAVLGTTALLGCGSSDKAGQSGTVSGPGNGVNITSVKQLKPFQFDAKPGPKPNLPKRLSFANVNTAQTYILMANGMRAAAKDRGMSFSEANAQTNVSKNVSQIQTFLQRGTGAMQLIPLGPGTQDAVSRQAFAKGVAVFNLTTGPSTMQAVADQAKVGGSQGQGAADWIRQNLGGKATVGYFNVDAIAPVLVARHKAAIAALKTLPGVKIVDISAGQTDLSPEGGFKLTSSLLQAHPDVNVIMGPDSMILGANKAVKAAGNSTVKYISGVDGDDLVLNEIKKGGLIKATYGFAWPTLGYAIGQFAADWTDGLAIPQAVSVDPIPLDSPAAIDRFLADQSDPERNWKDGKYLTFLGSISYATRNRWIRGPLGS